MFPVIVASWAGTQGVDKVITWSALSLGTGRKRILWEIVLPAALPTVFTGLQLALPISLIVELICEMAMGGQGLGRIADGFDASCGFAGRFLQHRRDRARGIGAA